MQGPAKQYTKEMSKKFGYRATWLPGVTLHLGDIGTLDEDVFNRVGNLADKNITFEIVDDKTSDDLEYSSSGEVGVSSKIAGKAAPPGSSLGTVDAGVIVDFTKENAIYFKALNTKNSYINDIIKLGEQILELFNEGKWKKKYFIITELVTAESATILISNSSNGKIELKANANINAPKIDIADAKFEWGTEFSKGMDTKIISQSGNTPLFKIQGITTRIIGPDKFEIKSRGYEEILPSKIGKDKSEKITAFGYIDQENKY